MRIPGSIGAKIFAAFAAMSLMLGALGAYGIYVLSEAGDIVADTYDRPLMAINFARSASQLFTEMDKEMLRRSMADPKLRGAIDAHIDELGRGFADDLAIAAERALSERERGLIGEITDLAEGWKALRPEAEAAAAAGELDRLAEAIIRRFDMLTELTAEHAFIERRQGISEIQRFRSTSIIATFIVFTLAAIITVVFARRIIHPLSVAAGIADRIARGELKTAIPRGGKDETGILLRSMTVMQDNIREMMERETAQRRSAQSRLLAALESSHEGMVLVDALGRVVVANSQTQRFFPSVVQNLVQGTDFKAAFAHLPKDLMPAPVSAAASLTDALDAVADHSRELQLSDGRWVRVSRSETEDGGFFLLFSDVTEIRERADMLQAVMESIPDGLVILGATQGAVFWNKNFLRLVAMADGGRMPVGSALAGVGLNDLVRPFGLGRENLEGTDGLDRAVELILGNGTSLRFHLLNAGAGNELLWVWDTTERKRQESDRRALQERVLQTQKSDAIGAIVGTVAHDFNNLLTAIMGFAALSKAQLDLLTALPEKLPTEDPEARRVVRHVLDAAGSVARTQRDIVDGATRGQRIVANLTEFAKSRKSERAVGDMMATVREAEQLIQIAMPSSVHLEIGGRRDAAFASHDRVMLEQVLLNLCLNGAHALEGRPGRIRIQVQTVETDGRRADALRADGRLSEGQTRVATDDTGWIHVWRGVIGQGRYVRIDVSDNGSGMDEARMARIFETFFTTKPKGIGTGLGLASVASVMDSHGGAIHVRSRPGHGTTFSLFLRQAKEGDEAGASGPQPAAADRLARPADPAVRKGARIIVIDDEQSLAKLMELTLTDQGYVVERFSDPTAAIQRLRRDPGSVDLVVTDQTMPGMTGTMLAEQTQSLRRDLPVLLCTGYSAEHIDDDRLPDGVHALLRKPYKPADLAECVRRMLAN